MKRALQSQPVCAAFAALALLAGPPAIAEEPEADPPLTVHDRLVAGTPLTFVCNYTIWQKTYSPSGTPTGGAWVDKFGTGTLDAKLTGNTVTLSNKQVSDVLSSGSWAPSEWTFTVDASGEASYTGFFTQSVDGLPNSLTLQYSYFSSKVGVRSSCTGFVH